MSQTTPEPDEEQRRLAVLRDYQVLDTPPEQVLDELAELAAQLCAAPIALISLIDERRQWIKAKTGHEVSEVPREISICAQALRQTDLLIVPDATQDARFAKNPQVTGAPGIRLYAGAPLMSPEGAVLGTLCVIDRVPHALTPVQERTLRVLSRQVMSQLELRRRTRELRENAAQTHELFARSLWLASFPELNPNPVIELELGSGVIHYLNPGAQRLFPDLRERGLAHPVLAGLAEAVAEAEREPSGVVWRENEVERGHFTLMVTLVPETGRVRIYASDITARKESELVSRRLAAIVESSDDAIVGEDLDGIVTSWNRGAERVFGYTADEMIGASITRIFPASRGEEEHLILARIRRSERVGHFEAQRQTKDGRLIEAAVTVSAIRDAAGRVIGASKIARDVTAVKERERELARISRLYAALSQVNQAIVWIRTREELFQKICEVLVEFGGFGMAWIGWRDAATQRLAPVAVCGDEDGYLQSIEVYTDDRPEGRGPTGTACREGRPYICNDLFHDPATTPWQPEVRRRGWRASAAFPIRIKDEVCGALSVYAGEAGFFRDKEVALLVEAAGDISFALENLDREAARREAEARVQNEKAFSDTMIESMPGILYFYDHTGRFLRWNRNFELVSGYSGDEIARMHPLNFFETQDQRSLQERIAEVFAHGESSVEAPFRSKDGRTTPYFFTGRRIIFEGMECLVGMGIDITERKQAEQALQTSEAKLNRAQRIAHLGSWELELSSNRLSWSDEVFRIFGLTQAEFGATYEAFMAAVHPDDRARLAQARERALTGEEHLSLEHRIVRPDRSVRWVYEIGELERDAAGRAVKLTGTVLDITERKHAEELLREAMDHLELKVTERTAELQAALVRAEAADRLKSAFLATMSHELRTPLNSIIGFTGTVLLGLAGPLNDEQKKQLGMVRSSARHLLELINDVLDLSKIEAGQFKVRAEAFDLRASLERVIATIQPLADRKALSLASVLPPEIGEMVSDRRRVEQVLLNLLNNAIKFTEHGGVTLTAALVTDYRPAPEATPQHAVRLAVADTGIGIEAGELATLFQPFQQLDIGTARTHEGTGLGLAICRRLATLLGGQISVASVSGRGSEFTVTLPLQKPRDP